MFKTLMLSVANLGPFVLYVYYASIQFCELDPLPSYCRSAFPNVYSYIQSRYWNQGFLKYWNVREIPNFLLCAPAVFFTLVPCCIYMKRYIQRHPLLKRGSKENVSQKMFMLQNDCLVYVVHVLVLVIFGLFCMHTQVITRFISACPAFYWGMLWFYDQKKLGIFRYLPIVYCVFYTFFGGVMFASFYPWT